MKNQNRREFLNVTGLVGSVFVAGVGPARASEERRGNDEELGMLYDATQCVGCKACMAVCKRVNGDYGSLAPEQASFDPEGKWDAPQDLSGNTRTIIKLHKEAGKWSYIKHSCMHCQRPSCVSVCPVSAMFKDKVTGVVDYNKNTCLGCRYCQIACAFNIPKFEWDTTTPQIVKCDLCRNTNLKEKGVPACVEVCPTEAILFGKRSELLEEARTRLETHPGRYVPHIYGEHEVGGTNHLYIAGVTFEKLGLPALPDEVPTAMAEKIQHTIYKAFIAPLALYGALCFVALRNMKRHGGHDSACPGDPQGAAPSPSNGSREDQ